MRERAAREAEAMEAHAEKAGRKFIHAENYYDLPGIPMPELALWNFASVCRYLISVLVLVGLLFAPIRVAARTHEVTLVPQGTASVKLRNCNLLVTPAKPGAASSLRLQYWAFMGEGWATKRGDGAVEARMEYSKRNKFFQCTAVLRLESDFVFGSLQVSSDGETIMEQVLDAPKLQLKAGKIHVQKGQVFLTHLVPMGPVLVSLHQGMAEIQLPSAPQPGGKLSLRSKEAAVALHSPQSMKVEADKQAATYTILRGEALDAALGDSLKATVGPSGGEAHEVQLSGEEAPFYIVSSKTPIAEAWEDALAKEWRGSGQKEAAILPLSKKELNETAAWVEKQSNFRVFIRALGPGMPKGVWEVISCRAYLVFSSELFVLLSAGMLYPHTMELDVHLTGSDILSSEPAAKVDVEKDSLHSHDEGPPHGHGPFQELSYDEFAGSEGAKVMGQLEAAEESESIFQVFRLISSALGEKVAGLMVWCPEHEELEKDSMEHARCLVFEGGHDHQAVRARLPQFMDYAAFLMAVLLNLLGSFVFVVFVIRFIRGVAMPWVWAEMRAEAIKEGATHRLQYMGSEAAWRVFAVLVQSPEHGVLLRWTTKAEFTSVVDFRFFAEAVDQPHRVSFEVNRIHVGTLSGNPYQKEYVVTVWPSSDDQKSVVAREPLRYQHTYKFRIAALGDKRRVLLESLWTSPIQIDPPMTLSEFPFLLQKVFFPAKLSTLQIFAGHQVTQKVLETKVALCRLFIDIDHKLHGRMERNQAYGETVLISVSWTKADGSPFTEAEERDAPVVMDMDESAWVRKSDVLNEEELATCSDAALYMRNTVPLTIVVTRTTGKQRHLCLKVASSTGMEYLYFRFSLQELMARWEQQSQLCRDERFLDKKSRHIHDDNKSPPSLLELLDLNRAQERLAQPWARDSHFSRHVDGGMASFWVAMGDNDPYPSGPFRWQLFPTTPYRLPTEEDAGVRIPGRLPWARCPVRNIWPSEMLLMGTEKLIEFDHEWVDADGGRNDLTHTLDFELRPASGQGRLRRELRKVAEAVDASTKHMFTWRVPYEAKDLDGRFIIVCRAHGDTMWRQGSVEFFIDRPLLLQDFELAYAAWCRSYKLPMDEVSPEILGEQSLVILEEPLAAVQGIRAVFPMEQQGAPDLELCSSAKGIFPCHRAVVLEGSSIPCRSAIRHVQVLEGASWSHRPWGFDVMLIYNGDVSWSWSKAWASNMCPQRFYSTSRPLLRKLIHSTQEGLAWMLQLVFFLITPTLILLVLGAHQFLHAEFNPVYREVTARHHCMQLVTEKFFHREFWHLDDLELKLQVPLVVSLLWIVIMPVILGYMNFAKDALPWFHHIAASIIKWLSLGSGLIFVLLASTSVFWMILGALLDPMGLAPVAVMVGALLTISQTMLTYLFEQQQKVLKTVKALMEPLLLSQLDEFVRGRPDLRAEVEGGAKTQGGDSDPEKADFLRALCLLGTYVKPKSAPAAADAVAKVFSKSDLFVSGGDEDNAVGKAVEAENWFADTGVDADAQNQLLSATREKIAMIYQYLLRHTPLRGGVGEALRDKKALAHLGYDCREQSLRRILDNGGPLVVGILENMLSVGLSAALVSILQMSAESRINLVDQEALSESIVVFFDRDLAGLISTHLQSSLDRKFDGLIARAERLFAIMDPQKVAGRERTELEKRLAAHDNERKRLQEEADWKWPFDLPMVDATDDAVANISLLSVMQELGIIPSYSVYLMRDGGQSSYDMLSMLEPLLEESYHWCEAHVGSSVLRKHDVLTYIRSQIDSVGDGRVDQLWYSAFHELCEEIYLVGRECPLTPQDVDNAWLSETPTRLLMDATRVDDTILSSLMTDPTSNEKKLWKEAFCLLARSLHVWPEIPLDDAVVELVRVKGAANPAGYRLYSFVPTVSNMESDAHGRLLKKAEVTVQPNPLQLMDTAVYSDRHFGFRSYGEFGPHSGYAYLQTPFKDLNLDGNQSWVVFDWDRDAKEGGGDGRDTSREPPFPGPLEVFLIFYNLNPQQDRHARRRWIYEEGWQLREDMQLPRVTEKELSSAWKGFAEPEWFTDAEQRPVHEVRSKIFAADPGAKFGSPRSCVELKGLAANNLPVLIFMKVGRTQIPDPNSFADAHNAPFLRSVYFEEAWNFRDQHESLLRFNKPENNWMIGAHDDAAELIRDLMMQRFVLQGTEDLEDGRSSASTAMQALHGTEPEDSNPSVRRIVPEELGKSHEVEFLRTGRMKPFWLRSVGEGFYVEDMDFVQLDAVRYRHFRYVPKKLKGTFPDGKKVPQAGKLSFSLQNRLVWQSGWGNAQERRITGEILVSFNSVVPVDEFGLVTFGGSRSDEDPVRFELYASDADSPPTTASGWGAPIFTSTFDYPLDNESELIRIGVKQDGMVWVRNGLSWYRMRGLWFDAFEELLTSLNLRMDRQAAWALWRRFVSFKYPPTAKQDPPGFVLVRDIKDALLQLLREEPFMSDTTFLEFNTVSRLQLEHHFAQRFYAKICDLTPDFLGAHNLVRWTDFKEHLHDHILQSKPYVSMPGRREEFSVGGIWFEALYQTVITSMPEVPARDEVKEHYQAYVNPSSGLLPVSRIYDVIAKLGRPGLKYEAFEEFMRKLGLRINSGELLCAFQLIDIDQDFVLGVNELQCGMSILIHSIVPDSVLKLVHLQTTQVLSTTLMALAMLGVVFLFLLLSFNALGSSGSDSYASSGIQSGLAGVAAVGIQAFQLGSFKEDRLNDYVLVKLETFMGIAAQRLAARQQHQKMGAAGHGDGSSAKAASQ